MKSASSFLTSCFAVASMSLALAALPRASFGQTPAASSTAPTPGLPLYESLKQFSLSGGAAQARDLVLERDRVHMTFTGTFYFESPIEGRIRGAVFIGSGRVHADPPDDAFEKDNLRRMIGADAVESTFKTAVLRFSDDTADALGLEPAAQNPPSEARSLASGFSPHLLRETGANVNARMVVSILNQESPGIFCAEFDGGSRGRFGLILDYQARLPEAHFGLDGGESGLFFAYDDILYRSDIWMAFFSHGDHQKVIREKSDAHALADISRYDMSIDLRDGRTMKLEARMKVTALADGLRAIPLVINEDLDTNFNHRRDRAMHLEGARLADGTPIVAIQEPWDGSVTIVLPEALAKGQVLEPIVSFKGEYLLGDKLQGIPLYPRGRTWYPRTVPLFSSAFDLTFHHDKGTLVDSIGNRAVQHPAADGSMLTEWRMDEAVRTASFVVGLLAADANKTKVSNGNDVMLEYYRLIERAAPESIFVLTEMGNCVRYFSKLFGPYPYSRLAAIENVRARSSPTNLILSSGVNLNSRDSSLSYGREISQQWWDGLITWRSYREQWLDAGLAEYSGLLYTRVRYSEQDEAFLVGLMHDNLTFSPRTLAGLGSGHLADVGPIVMGRRLSTRETFGAWDALIYFKGALVLRMLDFVFSDPATGDDTSFFDMIKDFVGRYAGKSATTEDFILVANQHFVDTPIAKQCQMKDLNWFFQQWVYETPFPSYGLSYSVTKQPDGSAIVIGTVTQKSAPNQWMMPLPVVASFGKGKTATRIVLANGAEAPIRFELPAVPNKIELDPSHWVLSQKTNTIRGAAN